MSETSSSTYSSNTYMIISRVGYLSGVSKGIFQNPHEPLQMECFDQLEDLKHARIIRHLSRIRNAIEVNYSSIYEAIRYDFKNLSSVPQYVPQESLAQLQMDGIIIEEANRLPDYYIIKINDLMCNHINNCRDIFPDWVKWDYVRALFIMPNGQKKEGIKKAASYYYANKEKYPYQIYLNWTWQDSKTGNILYNDEKFLNCLYMQHEDYFMDYDKVSDASERTKFGLHRFLEETDSVDIIVDCENADPYKLRAAIDDLDQMERMPNDVRIILIDDNNTTVAWQMLQAYTQIKVEYIQTTRLLEHKSVVDHVLLGKFYREYYSRNVRKFILVSSDSDFWQITHMEEADFYWMLEREKTSPALLHELKENGVDYCFTDDFCTGMTDDIKRAALDMIIRNSLSKVQVDLREMVETACLKSRAAMSAAEKREFLSRFLKHCRLDIDANGIAQIVY